MNENHSLLKVVKNPTLLNPFYWFAFIWTGILILHSFNIAAIYPQTPFPLFCFLVVVLVASFIFGKFYQEHFLRSHRFVFSLEDKPNRIWAFCMIVAMLFQVLYLRMLPIIEVLRGNPAAYQSFTIPQFSFLFVSLTIALNAIASVKLFYGGKRYRNENGAIVLLCWLIFLLSYSRGILIFCAMITAAIGFSRVRFTWKRGVIVLILALLGALLFNIAGNWRQKSAWNDSSYIMRIAGFKEGTEWLSPISWFITYVDTPWGNLCYNYLYVPPTGSVEGLLSQLLPDFLAKRIFPAYSSDLFLVQPGLTVSSMFAGTYKYFGIFGMFLGYLELVAFIFIAAGLVRCKTESFLAITASLSMIAAMSFFSNMVTYSGYSFFILFILLYSCRESPKKIIVTKKIADATQLS